MAESEYVRELQREAAALREENASLRFHINGALGYRQVTHIHAALREALGVSPAQPADPCEESKRLRAEREDFHRRLG